MRKKKKIRKIIKWGWGGENKITSLNPTGHHKSDSWAIKHKNVSPARALE